MTRYQQAIAGPALGFLIATLVVFALRPFVAAPVVAAVAVALGLGISSYAFPAPGRRRRAGFSIALGALAAFTAFLLLRATAPR